jgi:hypothetical protein
MNCALLLSSMRHVRRLAFTVCSCMLVVSCAAPAPQRPEAPSAAIAFDTAIDYAVDDLLVQAQRLPEFQPLTKDAVEAALRRDASPRSKIVVDVALDSVSGQQTLATRFLDARLMGRAMARFPQFDVAPLGSKNQTSSGLPNGRFLLAAVLSPLGQQASSTDARFRINLSLTDLQTGYVFVASRVIISPCAAGHYSEPAS